METMNEPKNGLLDTADIVGRLRRLPYATPELPGIRGALKASPDHFRVEEVMPYEPSGSGEHAYITLRRSGWNTADVARELGNVLKVPLRNIGWGGMKDRHACTTQTFSLTVPRQSGVADIGRQLREQTPFEIVRISRHTNKIRRGHVRANRFQILLSGCRPETDGKSARAIASALRGNGLPNFFGEQRFGADLNNVPYAARLLQNGKLTKNPKSKFWVSVLQSAWFNLWLADRMARGDFHRLLPGDIAKKTDTGGLFTVVDPEAEQGRFDRRELTYCGPIFGFKMMPAADQADTIEKGLMDRLGIDPSQRQTLKSPGSRRPALLWLDEIQIEPVENGLLFSFELPSGSYATVVMREFVKGEAIDA